MQSNLSSNAMDHSKTNPFPASTASSALQGLHVAIIMDGNGRWATQRNRPRIHGHRMGVEAVRKVIHKAPSLGIGMLTLYAFSSDNWKRPAEEVTHLFSLLGHYLKQETERFAQQGIRLVFVGRRDRIAPHLRQQIDAAERRTASGTRLIVRIAFDYSAREQILTALATQADATPERISRALSGIDRDWPVDLLIRTSGEQRLSDFMLWECAYAELHFTPIHWPDFDGAALADAVGIFERRERRFGAIPA